MKFDKNSMITIHELRSELRKNQNPNRQVAVRDVSGGNSFGYHFALIEQRKYIHPVTKEHFWDDGKILGKSFTASFPDVKNKIGQLGAFSEVFSKEVLKDI